MKKTVCIVLTLMLVLCLCVPALAANPITSGTGTDTADVKAKYVDSTTQPTVYSVDLVWGAMEFTYTDSGVNTWDPATHTYSATPDAGWTASGNTVKVTNHSNAGVNAAFSYESLTTYTSVSGSFDKTGAQALNAGVENKPSEADNVTATLTLSGSVADTLTTFTKVGTVTVTLSPVA